MKVFFAFVLTVVCFFTAFSQTTDLTATLKATTYSGFDNFEEWKKEDLDILGISLKN